MVWRGKGSEPPLTPPMGGPSERPTNPPTGGSLGRKPMYVVGRAVDLSGVEKVGPGPAYYTNKGGIQQYNLIVTDRRLRGNNGHLSKDTITLVYHWQELDSRSLIGRAWSSVVFVGVAGAELLRSNPEALEAIKRGCLTHNTPIIEV